MFLRWTLRKDPVRQQSGRIPQSITRHMKRRKQRKERKQNFMITFKRKVHSVFSDCMVSIYAHINTTWFPSYTFKVCSHPCVCLHRFLAISYDEKTYRDDGAIYELTLELHFIESKFFFLQYLHNHTCVLSMRNDRL